MASVKQWTKWREDYYAGLKQIIDDAPYKMAKLAVESEVFHYVPDVAKTFVDKAINEGVIKESEHLSYLKMSYFAMSRLVAYQEKNDISVQDVEVSYHEPDSPCLEIAKAEDYISYAILVFHLPLIKACRYVLSNHPLACKNVIKDLFKRTEEQIDFSYFRLRKEVLFDYFRSITPFCLHNMLADMKCPYAEEVFDAVQDGDYDFFKTLCYDKNIDFTELSEIVGYLQSGLIGNIDEIEGFLESDECSEEEMEEKTYSRIKNVTSMAGLPLFNKEDFMAGATIFKQDFIGELIPFIQTEDDASIISAIAFDVANLYSYIERMDEGELKEINRLLDHPDFEALVKLAQGLFCAWYDRFPNNVTINFSQEEQNEMLSYTQSDKIAEQGDTGRVSTEGVDQKPQLVVSKELHWPTQEELDGYPLKRNDTEFFKESIFGMAASVKVSHIEALYNLLVSQKVLQDDLESKLILLARYTGRRIPLLELRPIEWRMSWTDKDRSLGYFLLRTANSAYSKGVTFFYYDDDGIAVDLGVRPVSMGAHNWKNRVKKPKFAEALDTLLLEDLKLTYPED